MTTGERFPHMTRPDKKDYGRLLSHFTHSYQEDQIYREAVNFSKMAPLAWGPDTLHPDYPYNEQDPRGQCSVTIGGFAIWLVWREVCVPEQINYNRGRIVDEDGEVVGDHHAHLLIDSINGLTATSEWDHKLELGLDFTGGQFPGLVGPLHTFWRDRDGEVTRVHNENGDVLFYETEKSDSFAEYDTAKFDGRLINFMGHFYSNPTLFNLFSRPYRGSRNDLWWPHDSKYSRDEIFDRLEASPKIEIPRSVARPASARR